jgi:hypothetical protein
MVRIGQREVDGVDDTAGKQLVVVLVRDTVVDLVLPAEGVDFSGSSLTSAVRTLLRLACANAGSTADWAL